MRIDNVFLGCITKAAKKGRTDPKKAVEIIEELYKCIELVINTQKPTCIKIDFFGKFFYSELWKAKKESIAEKHMENKQWLDGVNGIKFRD
jgi:hypothetical protein